jgi:spore coat protein U-like protein
MPAAPAPTPYNIALEPSGTPTPTDGKGTLRNAGTASNNPDTYVSYGLYRDVGRSLPWGNVSNSNTLGGTGTGSYAASPINIYGRINNGNVRPGSYTDNVLVNVLY